MKQLFLTFLFFSIVNFAKSQLDKKTWLAGGTGSFLYQNQEIRFRNSKAAVIQAAPNLGYFFADKLAAGMRLQFSSSRINTAGSISKGANLGIGPFIRYYFLNKENRTNLLSEVSFTYNDDLRSTSNSYIMNIGAGPVIYFNSSVGVELTANYQMFRSGQSNSNRAGSFILAIGLQVHLEREE